MRSIILTTLLFVSSTALPTLAAAVDIVVLTGGTGGVYYPLGLALSNIFQRTIPEARVSVLATQATVENFNLLQQRRGSLAFGQGDVMSAAVKGSAEAGFHGPRDRLRMVAAIYPNLLHLVALKSARITSLRDLKGKRVSVGALRSGNEVNARVVLGAVGMSYADLGRVDYLPYNESIVQMKAGQTDAMFVSAGMGVTSVASLAAEVAVDIVPIPAEVIAHTNGAFVPIAIPPRTYPGQESTVVTAGLDNYLVTHADVPEALVYQMLRQLFANLGEFQAAHPAARGMSLEHALRGRPIPLHPGAERYYREVGLLK